MCKWMVASENRNSDILKRIQNFFFSSRLILFVTVLGNSDYNWKN